MNYSNETKPAKILNLGSLDDVCENLYLTSAQDTAYYSMKKAENNSDRVVFSLQTSDIKIAPQVRQIICLNKNKKYNGYQSFLIEPKDKSTGIVIIIIKQEEQQIAFCNVRILPLSTLSDIAEPEADSKLLTVNLQKSKCILKVDITITKSNTGEALYSVHDIDLNAIANLVTTDEIINLKRELEFQGSKLIAHYFQEILSLELNDNPANSGKLSVIPDDYIAQLSSDKLKKMITANAINGCIALEIVGSNVIQDLNRDWTAAGAFIGYIL